MLCHMWIDPTVKSSGDGHLGQLGAFANKVLSDRLPRRNLGKTNKEGVCINRVEVWHTMGLKIC